MTLFPSLLGRVRRSRPATVLAAALAALLLSVAGPPVLSALGGQSAPVGCQSAAVGDFSNPCAYDPPSIADSGGEDSADVDDDVIEATPPFAG